MTHIIIIFSK